VLPRSVFAILVFALPVLVVAFGILMGGSALARATEDLPAANVLQWVALSLLMLTLVDLVLLVGALGLKALAEENDRDQGNAP
jgi:hypothetical protein